MTRLDWEKLLCEMRIRDACSENKKITANDNPIRNRFDEDYDRIIYSSSLRRLQDKTQVFPLQQNDFIRTRLTHSLEVSALGESIAWQIVDKLRGEKKDEFFAQNCENLYELKKLPSLVRVACLVHDLGNPPFGHYGEDIIKKWFKNYFESNKKGQSEPSDLDSAVNKLTEKQKNDFLRFDGNAQNLHILSKLQFLNDEYGMNFTLGTLAALMKYPYDSSHKLAEKKQKFGYLQSEKKIYQKIYELTGVGEGIRHPETYIIEAADDIAYKVADLEDGIKKGLLKWEDVYTEELQAALKSMTEKHDGYPYKEKIEGNKAKDIPGKDLIQYQNLKIYLQGTMVRIAVDNFINHYEEIMSGKYDRGQSLIEDANLKEVLKILDSLTRKYCFASTEVLELELRGEQVISDLLDLFVPAICRVGKTDRARDRNQKLIYLISENFAYVHCLNKGDAHARDWRSRISELDIYSRLQLVVDFISGMTDSYAVSLHKKLKNLS
ncbi:TPA: dNTP triphosphohydrolase [Streptococcus suis]|nr:dNTP triphosphohydrolase [Streptococcus suis]